MAQTERTYASIETLLADNVIGAINPQDLRDAIASLTGYGGLLLSTSGAGATMNTVGTTPVLIDVFDTITAQSASVNTAGIAAQLSATYSLTIGATGIYMVSFWASLSSSAIPRTLTFQLFRGGVVDIINLERYVSASDTGAVAFSQACSLTAADVLDMRVFGNTGTTNLTFRGAGFSVNRAG